MITIPCAVATPYFKWQIDLFQYRHFQVYGDDAVNKAIIPIVKRNHITDEIQHDVDWDLRLPYKMVDSVLDMLNLTESQHVVNNVFTAAYQVSRDLDDDEYLEIIDADLFHLKKHDGYLPKDDEVVVDATYENWHLHINGANYIIVEEHLKHDNEGYMNGGFNVILKKKTFDLIYDEAVEVSIKIAKEHPNSSHSWWALMYGLNVACHNHKIKMIDERNCYYPHINEINDNQHIAHYSCDPKFNKHKYPNVDSATFPDNKFYNIVKEWMNATS